MPTTIKKTITNYKFSFKKPGCDSEVVVTPNGDVQVTKHETSSPAEYIQKKMAYVSEIRAFMKRFKIDSISCVAVKEVVEEVIPDKPE